jgi:hypothetical protein
MTKYILAAIVAAALCGAGCSQTTNQGDTYRMPKGGMSSVDHEMKNPPSTAGEATDEQTERKQPSTYRMPKGGMSSSDHEMKR